MLRLLNWACELFFTNGRPGGGFNQRTRSDHIKTIVELPQRRGCAWCRIACAERHIGVNHSWRFVAALFSSQPCNDTTSGCEAHVFSSADRSLFSVSVQFTQMLMLSKCVCWLTIAGQQQEKTMAGTSHVLTITLSVNLLHFISIVLTQCSERLDGNIFSANLFGENSPRVLCVTRSTHRTALRG